MTFLKKFKEFPLPEPRPASFSHALWALLVIGLIAKLTHDKGVPMFILGGWAAVTLSTLLVCLQGTLKQLRTLLIADAMLALVLLSMLFFSDVILYSYSGTSKVFSPHFGQQVEIANHYFEMFILAGQTLFAAYLANVTHSQIQERIRMELLK